MTENTAATTYYPDAAPVLAINSFTVKPSNMAGSAADRDIYRAPNTPVTFNFCVTGTNYNETFRGTTAEPYAYIDMVGPARLEVRAAGA